MIIKKIFPALVFIIISLIFHNCDKKMKNLDELYAERTINANRQQFQEELISKTIEQNLKLPLNKKTESQWQGAFWGMGLAEYRSETCDSAIEFAVDNFFDHSTEFKRSLLEVIYGLYPDSFSYEIEKLVRSTNNPKIFAMGIEHLLRIHPGRNNLYHDLINKQFTKNLSNPILFMLSKRLKGNKAKLPPLTDLFAKPFDNKLLIFSFHRKNRDFPGLTVIRKPNGKFLRNSDGSLFHIRHLARSNSALPGYLTNGNTPQGIYSLQGLDISENVFIGPTPTLQMRLPHETSQNSFLHNKDIKKEAWTLAPYKELLPESWRNYFPIYSAYYAGKAGRSAIIAHGSTINPDFYQAKPYYPLTPSLGCLTALELWSGETGECIYSEQLALIEAYRKFDSEGYLILLDLNNKKYPVTINDIIDKIITAEEMTGD